MKFPYTLLGGTVVSLLTRALNLMAGVTSDGNVKPIRVNSDGELMTSTSVTSESTAEATAAAPTYTEGQDAPLSQDLKGNLRVRTQSTTPAQSTVGDSATNVTLLAANTARKGATIYNDSSALLYLKLGATASTTSFTAILLGNGGGLGGYFEVPYGYTGIIDGIWASDAGGNARITELT